MAAPTQLATPLPLQADQRADGMFECPDCQRTYESARSLTFCCNPAALRSVGVRDLDG